MTPASLTAFRERMGWNRTQAAEHIGIDRKTMQRLEKPETKVPLYIALACAALAADLEPLE